MTGLLDVNVLIALFDPAHPNHEDAHNWFGSSDNTKWATCPMVVNGCVRVLSNPAYPTVRAVVPDVMTKLKSLCAIPKHIFWPDDVSLLDDTVFRAKLIDGHQKITDVYLLALAVAHRGCLATLDHRVALSTVPSAKEKHLLLL